jgi:hypothetical protein
MSAHEQARQMRQALLQYQAGRWRRDRIEQACRNAIRGKLTEVLFCILRQRDAVPSKRIIRRALSLTHGPTKQPE